ncbi:MULTISPECIES: LemA family protein [Microvirga]|uniref:LemA family protein n=1 Tax=Microvirga TaxID=186650 RepID=UPI00352FF592
MGLLLALAACDHGDVPALRERAQQAWSEVQNQYRQRADQVPPLVEAVRRKAPAEREVLAEVMAAHDEVVAIRNADGFLAEPERFRHNEQAQQRLSDALERLYATVKRYPETHGRHGLAEPAAGVPASGGPAGGGPQRSHQRGPCPQ